MSLDATASGAEPPAYPKGFLPLSELGSRSGRIGKWRLAVFHPWVDEYGYEWDGNTKKGCCFKCLLVDVEQPSMYCHAEFKKTRSNEKTFQATVKKFTEEALFAFEKVGFVDSVKAQYLTAPKREVINLATTTAQQALGSTSTKTSAVQPCPTGSVADKMELQQTQQFDLIALVKEVSELRPTTSGRKVFDVCLIDGSEDPQWQNANNENDPF